MDNFAFGVDTTIKVGAGGSFGGNFLPLAIDGSGGKVYRESITDGSTTVVNVGEAYPSEPGNLIGPTFQGLRDRIGPGNGCDPDALTDGSGARLLPGAEDDPCVIIVPIIVEPTGGKDDLKVLGFAALVLDGNTQDWNQAQGTIDARFVELAFPVSGVAGPPGKNPVAPEAFQLIE
jgi:hypothetical protein